MRKKTIETGLFWKAWLRILEECETGAAIIVEGKKDYLALRELKVKGHVITLNTMGYSRVLDFLERSNINRVIILTDFDKEGELEADKLGKLLKRSGIEVLDGLREELRKSLLISKIEELRNWVNMLIDNAPSQVFLKDLKNEIGIIDQY